MRFQYKSTPLCTLPGDSSFIVPPYAEHAKLKLVKWKYHGEGLAVQYDPALTAEEEKELFSQQGLTYVETKTEAKLEIKKDLEFVQYHTYDYRDLI